jgi:chemotaxis-related protein WspD
VIAELPTIVSELPCWHRIGVWGDQSCPELLAVTHCHNCPVFATAGRKFLDAESPPDYLAEWTERLAVPEAEAAGDVIGVLVFRLADEWLGCPVGVLVEVTHMRPPHRIPHRGGILAGLVNIRGELHLCARLDLLLGITTLPESKGANPRLLVIRQHSEGWAFAADEVDQVHRIPLRDVQTPAPTLSRAVARVTRGVFHLGHRSVGLLDSDRVFQFLAERMR